MELKLRKRIQNSLPKYDGGTEGIRSDINLGGLPQQTDADKVTGMVYSKEFTSAEPSGDSGGSGVGLAGIGNVVSSGILFASAANNSFSPVKSANEMLAEAGYGTNSVMGISYKTPNNINAAAQRGEINRENTLNTLATAGAGAGLGGSIGTMIMPGVGTAAGAAIGAVVGTGVGLIGGARRKHKLRKKIREALILANQQGIYNRSEAMSAGLQQDYGLNYSNTQDDVLYANRGKDLRQPKRK